MMFSYKPVPDAPKLILNISFVRFNGPLAERTMSNAAGILLCSWENSGLQFVDFQGAKVLAPRNIPAYLESSFGPKYMNATHLVVFQNCPLYQRSVWASNLVNHSQVCFDQVKDWQFVCDADSHHCPSSHAANVLVTRMLQYLSQAAARHHLVYSLACDALVYARNPSGASPPSYGAIGVLAKDIDAWRAITTSMMSETTFVSIQTTDGSVMRIKYSHSSPVFVALWTVPHGTSLKIQQAKYGSNTFAVHAGSSAEVQSLTQLCQRCADCGLPASSVGKSARVRSRHTGLCLAHHAGQALLKTCDAQVLEARCASCGMYSPACRRRPSRWLSKMNYC